PTSLGSELRDHTDAARAVGDHYSLWRKEFDVSADWFEVQAVAENDDRHFHLCLPMSRGQVTTHVLRLALRQQMFDRFLQRVRVGGPLQVRLSSTRPRQLSTRAVV